jgi:hypothetical protein
MRSLARREGRRGLAGSGKEFQGGERERVVEEPGRAGQESLAGSGHGGAVATRCASRVAEISTFHKEPEPGCLCVVSAVALRFTAACMHFG